MAEASFTIRAIDATRQAFGQIQNSLAQLKNSSATAAAFMKRVFDPRALGTGLAAAFGISLVGAIDKAAEAVVRMLTQFNDVQKTVERSAINIRRIYAESAFALMESDQKLLDLAARRSVLEKEIAALRQKTTPRVVTFEAPMPEGLGTVRTQQAVIDATREESAALYEKEEALANIERQQGELNAQVNKSASSETQSEVQRLDAALKALQDSQKAYGERQNASGQTYLDLLNAQASAQLDLLDPMREFTRQLEEVDRLREADKLTEEQAAARRIQINAEAERAMTREVALLLDAAEAQRDILDPARQYQREIGMINDLLAKGLLGRAEAEQRIADITAASAAQRSAAEGEVLATMNQLEDARARITGEEINYAQRIATLREREKTMLSELATLGAAGPAAQIAKQRELIDLYAEMESLIEQQTRLGRDAGEMIASGFEDAILSGNKLSDVLRNLAQDLIRLVFRNTITAPLASAIGGILTGGIPFLAKGGTAKANSPYVVGEEGPELFVPGVTGAVVSNSKIARVMSMMTGGLEFLANGGTAKANSPFVVGEKGPELFVPGVTGAVVSNAKIARIMSMMSGGLEFLAKGGQARAGSAYMVGEEGPELFVPGSTGSVIPNSRLRGMDQANTGPTVNISYTIQSGVSRAELQPILEQERKRLRAEIPDMVRRGGSYRAAFA